MKFNCIQEDLEKNLERFASLELQDKLKPTEFGGQITDAYYLSIITALRMNQVDMTAFFNTALAEWEYIVNKMLDSLPRYIQENLNGYEIKEEIGE